MEVAGMLEGIVRANWGCNLMRRVGYHTGRFLAAILAALPALGFISAVEAGEPASEYSCEELWRERNAIYAEQGYCFKNAKVIAAFGRGCFPPYGKLEQWQKKRVAEVEYWEQRKGCR
jgi:hypothetical protein